MPKAAISVAGSDQIVKQIRDPLILDLRPHDMAAKSVANTIKNYFKEFTRKWSLIHRR